jgi:hypothetical protein
MLFNLTIFVQIFNFLIAYYLLSRFLFKPVLAQIERREQYLANLQARYDQRAQALELLMQQQQTVAHAAKVLFVPILQTIQAANNFVAPAVPVLNTTKLSKETLLKIETVVTGQVVKQVQSA